MPNVATAIAADGWQATVASPTDLSLDPVAVSRAGFDATGAATTHADTLKLTKRVRLPYPDQATLTADQVALSDYVYSTDTIAGATNNSTEASPKPIANWIMPHRAVVGDTVELEVAAFHRDARGGAQVACVVFSATDGTTTVSQLVASTAVSGRAGDQFAVLSYKAALDISTLDPGLITCNAKVYPWFGDASSVLDSADSSEARGFSPRYFYRDTTLATAPPLAYVDQAGNDSTGVVSTDLATAKASPFLTVSGAYKALFALPSLDGAVIMLGDDGGTPFPFVPIFVGNYKQYCAALTITRDPDVPRANARMNFGSSGIRPRISLSLLSPLNTGCLCFHDVGLVRTGTSGFNGESTVQLELVWDDVSIDGGGVANHWLSNAHNYFYGASITNAGDSVLAPGTYEHRILRGVSMDVPAGSKIENWLTVGCDFAHVQSIFNLTRTASGSIFAFNRVTAPTSTTLIGVGGSVDVEQVAIVQNVIEWTTTATGHLLGVSNDSAAGNNTHVVIHNNTHAGAFGAGRVNLFYDEGPTPRTSRLMSVKGNIFVQINTKSDVFRGINEAGGDASTRTGNWAFEYGVGCAGNFAQYVDAQGGGIGGSFAQDYPGLSCDIGESPSVRNDPLFEDYQGTTYDGTDYTAGAGGGDYRLQPGSPAIGLLPVAVLSHTLDGLPRPAANDNAGAMAVLTTVALVEPPLVASDQTFGVPTIESTATLSPAMLANGQSFPVAAVLASAGLSPPVLANGSTLLAPVVRGMATIEAGLLVNGQGFPSSTIEARSVLAAGLLESAAIVRAPLVTSGRAISPAVLVNSQGFPTPALTPGGVKLAAPLLASGAAVPAPVVSAAGALAPPLLVNAQVFPGASVSGGEVALLAPLVANDNALFAPAVQGAAARSLLPPVLASSVVVLTPELRRQRRKTVLRPITPGRQRPAAISRGW